MAWRDLHFEHAIAGSRDLPFRNWRLVKKSSRAKVTQRSLNSIQVPRTPEGGERFDDYYCAGTVPLAPHSFGVDWVIRGAVEYAVCSKCKWQVPIGHRYDLES
jgi:hypothetical protein